MRVISCEGALVGGSCEPLSSCLGAPEERVVDDSTFSSSVDSSTGGSFFVFPALVIEPASERSLVVERVACLEEDLGEGMLLVLGETVFFLLLIGIISKLRTALKLCEFVW